MTSLPTGTVTFLRAYALRPEKRRSHTWLSATRDGWSSRPCGGEPSAESTEKSVAIWEEPALAR
jgi:hypothetical protein